MLAKKIALIVGIMVLMVIPWNLPAVEHDWSNPGEQPGVKSPIQNQNGDPSPLGGLSAEQVTGQVAGSWVTPSGPGSAQFNVNLTNQALNSRVDDYINQDEQINLDANSGVVKVLRTNQKINTNQFATELIPFKSVPPRELRHVLRTVCRKEGGNADTVLDKEKGEYFMQVVCPDFQLPYIRSAAQELDVPWLKIAEDGDGNLYYKGKFRNVSDINWISQYYRGPEGYFRFDTANNALYFNDQPAALGLQKMGLSQIDIPPNQVRLDVIVYEVNTQNDDKVGLDWIDWKNGPGRNLFEGIFSSIHSTVRVRREVNDTVVRYVSDNVHSDYRYMSVDAIATAEFIDFLKVKGKAKELSKSTLMAKSGQTVTAGAVDKVVAISAVHRSVDDETIVRNPNVTNDGVTNLPQEHRRFVNFEQSGTVGVSVAMLPFIGLESMELTILLTADSVVGINANGLPVINNRSVSTKVRLKDGEPFVIGGLKRNAEVKRSVKVPILGSIPVLGWLFGQETNTNRETEIIAVVKPKFILGAESDMEIPQECQTIIAKATGKENIELPKNAWGFDQWLLDKDK
jgi:hypothetical protein